MTSTAASMGSGASSLDEPVISGPFVLFEGSFILGFLKPHPRRNASVLMRATYKHNHPLCKQGKKHPQSPPLHLHLLQSESFAVLSVQVGTTTTYGLVDTIHTPENTNESHPHEVRPWVPHTFWPDPDAKEDTTILVWAHPNPDDMDEKMDRLFFQNLLMYVSDVAEKKEELSVLQIMLTQHVSATALVAFPKAWFLGPLRWWVPMKLQALCATIARWSGRQPLLAKYMSQEEWQGVQARFAARPKMS